MDAFDDTLSAILSNVQNSSLSDQEKADVYSELHIGLRRLVWPILLSHMPEADLKQAVDNPESWTMDRYGELINKSLSDPATPKEIHDELMGALTEVDALTRLKLV